MGVRFREEAFIDAVRNNTMKKNKETIRILSTAVPSYK